MELAARHRRDLRKGDEGAVEDGGKYAEDEADRVHQRRCGGADASNPPSTRRVKRRERVEAFRREGTHSSTHSHALHGKSTTFVSRNGKKNTSRTHTHSVSHGNEKTPVIQFIYYGGRLGGLVEPRHRHPDGGRQRRGHGVRGFYGWGRE